MFITTTTPTSPDNHVMKASSDWLLKTRKPEPEFSRVLSLVSGMAEFDPASLPDLLPLYYRRIFPFAHYGRWLRYGDVSKNYFQRREFSFTLRDDIYVRFQSFNTPQELEKEIQKLCPYKIDIGAVYSHRPIQRNTVHMGAFQPQEKELVFDIDMTDYDDVRRCCSSAEICSKCWTLMIIAIRIIDRALVVDFGIKHRLWVYSGRRGVHCWVCDDAVRKWSSSLRSAAVEYLSVVKGGEDTIKKVTLLDNIHPFISESVEVVKKYFEKYALVDQDILGSKESYEKVLALVPENILLGALKGLKSMGWGRISVPIDLQKLDEFDPFAVPTISCLCHELDSISSVEGPGKENEGEPEFPRRSKDYKKTSLAPYVKVFEQFVEEMEKSHTGERRNASEKQLEF
ncbi:hypothetical protein lerEdw1_001565 [Lerista edwardsae]|nr:hypothetical protein lerEdw1_001565 [Lerista edwardsae]